MNPAIKTIQSPLSMALGLVFGFRKLVAALWEGRIPSAIGRRLVRDPEHSLFWRFVNWLCPTPLHCFQTLGFFPLPLEQVSYDSYKFLQHEEIKEFPCDEVPRSIHADGRREWARWGAELPVQVRRETLKSCHTVFIPNGWADCHGNVFSDSGCLVIGASLPFRNEGQPYYIPSTLRPKTYRTTRAAVIASSLQGCYYHWLFDVLPRIALLERGSHGLEHIFVQAIHPFQIDTLSLLGVNSEQIINAAHYDFITAERLIVPYHEIGPGVEYPSWVCEALRRAMIPASIAHSSGQRPKRIYISRQRARWRRVENEAEVLELLAPLGFQEVLLEELPLLEQVRLFYGAEAVIGAHGSGFSNLVFSQPGTKVIEFQPRKLQDVYFRLCRSMELDYCFLTSSTGPEDPINNNQQIHVDLHQLRQTLRLADLPTL